MGYPVCSSMVKGGMIPTTLYLYIRQVENLKYSFIYIYIYIDVGKRVAGANGLSCPMGGRIPADPFEI
jgi:hypothetical protein